MRRILTVVLLTLLIQALPLSAQQRAALTGTVSDRTSGSAVQGVTVRIEGTRLGAITDKLGRYRIANPPAGAVTVAASCIGYQPAQVRVTIGADRMATVDVTITPSDVVKSDVIVSASKRVQAVQDVPISVAVMRAADIDQRNITQLDEALTYVSGVTVARDQVNIRGASGFALGAGSRTAVLLDGFPMTSGDAGDIKFDVLPVADVERIEIIKGAGSALYGTGALGGVVSLMTKEPTEQAELSARLYGGAYTLPRYEQWRYRQTMPSQSGADLRFAQRFGDVSVSMSGGFRADESYRDLDAGHRGFAFAKASWQASETSRFTLFGLYAASLKQNLLYWKSLAEATRATAEQNPDEQLFSGKLAIAGEWSAILSGNTSILVRPGVFRTNFENRYGDTVSPGQPSTAYAYNLEVQSTSRIGGSTVLTSGVNTRVNYVTADLYGNQLQTLLSGYSQAEYTLDTGLIVTGGLRADYEQTRTLEGQFVLSPKLGLTWKLADQTALRASAGRGFRAASVAERYANVRYGPLQVVKNESIIAEYSWSMETGINHVWSDAIIPMEIDGAVFNNELFDMIEPTFLPAGTIQFQNVTRARVLGAELTLRGYLARGLGFETGLTLMQPRDLLADTILKYRNSVIWYSRGSWDVIDGLSVQAEYRYTDRVQRIDELNVVIDYDARVPVHIVDARIIANLRTLIGEAVPLTASVIGRNLADYYYTEVMGNLGPTRSITMQVEYKL